MDDARVEIWFPSPDEVSVFIETAAPNEQARELVEVGLFAAYAARQIANLRSGLSGELLSNALASIDHPAENEEIPQVMGSTRLVPASLNAGRKGFVGSLKQRNGLPLLNLKARGFGVLGRGVDFYAPTSTLALLLYLLRRLSPEGRWILSETAQNIGRLGMAGRIGVTSQAQMAGARLLHDDRELGWCEARVVRIRGAPAGSGYVRLGAS